MGSTIRTTVNGNSWDISPTNGLAGVVLAILFMYLLFRHFCSC